MHINTFDHFQNLESLIHRLDPRVKVIITVLFILSNVLMPDGAWLAFGFSWLVLVWFAILAGLNIKFIVTRSLVALPFAIAAITAIFTIPGAPLFEFDLGPWHLVGTSAGLIRFASIVIRSWLSIQMAIILTATTPFPDLIHALRHLKVPNLLVAVISFMYRYLFVLSDEVMRLLRAREARSASGINARGGGSIRWRAKVAGSMAGQLFLRSYERSERVYNAMLARGYDGTLLTLNPHTMRRLDWILGVVAVLIIIFLHWISRI
jgi:cobalt/nickel transport system permease protein